MFMSRCSRWCQRKEQEPGRPRLQSCTHAVLTTNAIVLAVPAARDHKLEHLLRSEVRLECGVNVVSDTAAVSWS